MKKIISGILVIYCLLASCYKPYEANIDAEDKILVVEGMITNEVASYHINLSYALGFYSEGFDKPVNSAIVYVTDDLGNNYPFRDSENGHYLSDSLQFTGLPGRTYTLYIETPDGFSYKSDPQRLYPNYQIDTIYSVPDYQKTLSRFNGVYSTIRGANIVININSDSDTLPHFRFNANLLRLYNYIFSIHGRLNFMLYCWSTDNTIMDINLTQNNYSKDFFSVNQHAVCFVDDKISRDLTKYELDTFPPYGFFIPGQSDLFPISHRILFLDQYTLNNETFLYYKRMDDLLSSEGKLFDPIAVQLRGNINCISKPGEKVFGFFEASSVSRTAYEIGFRDFKDQFAVKKVPYILPNEPNGSWKDEVPPFWIKK